MADIEVTGRGYALLVFKIRTLRAASWVGDNPDLMDHMQLGPITFAVEARYADTLMEGMIEAGLVVVEL